MGQAKFQQQQNRVKIIQQMSKQDLDKEFIKKNQKFEVRDLGQNSSESSSRRDSDFEISYHDEDSEHEQKIQDKDLDNISKSNKDVQNQFKSQKGINSKKFLQQQNFQYKLQRLQSTQKISSPVQLEDLNYQGQLQQRKRKRKQILQNIKTYNQKNLDRFTNKDRQSNKQKLINMNKIVFQKKKQNHNLLKNWNYGRIKFLEFNKSINQQILKGVERNMKLSMENFQAFKSFYIQRYKQEEIYLNQNPTVNANEDIQTQQNRISQQVYIASSAIFELLTKKEQKKKQITIQFITFLQIKIIKQIFQQYFDNIHKQFRQIYLRILSLREELVKIDQNACKKLIIFENLFGEYCDNINRETQKDFYRAQLSFLNKCQSQMLLYQSYQKLIVEYYIAAIDQQKKRKLLIQKSLNLYQIGLKKYQKQILSINNQIPGQQSLSRLIRQNTKEESKQIQIQGDTEQIKKMYNLQNFLQPQTIRQVKTKLLVIEGQVDPNFQQASDVITIQELEKYFIKCQVEEFNCQHLIMNKFGIQVYKEDKWIPGEIVITIDKFLHILVHAVRSSGVLVFGSRTFFKPECSIKMELVSLSCRREQYDDINTEEDLQLKIGVRKPEKTFGKIASLLKNSKNIEQKVRFAKQNDLLQFQEYIAQL